MKAKPVEKDSLKQELDKSKYDLSSYQVDLILKAFRIHQAGIKKELEEKIEETLYDFRWGRKNNVELADKILSVIEGR